MTTTICTVPEAAEMVNYSTSTIHRLIQDGKIPAKRIGNIYAVNVAALQAWKTANREPNAKELLPRKKGRHLPEYEGVKKPTIPRRKKYNAAGRHYKTIEEAIANADPKKAVYLPLGAKR